MCRPIAHEAPVTTGFPPRAGRRMHDAQSFAHSIECELLGRVERRRLRRQGVDRRRGLSARLGLAQVAELLVDLRREFDVIASKGVTQNATAGPFTVTVSTSAGKSADLSLAITAPAVVTKGSTITYSIVVINNGPSAATNIGLLLLAGPDVSLVSTSPAPQLSFDGLWN